MNDLNGFSVNRRNNNHWDVWASGKHRIFRIRGKGQDGMDQGGSFCVIGENNFSETLVDGFVTVGAAMSYITDRLMN